MTTSPNIKQEHLLKDRVQIRIGEDVISEDEIICDTGIITHAFYFIGKDEIQYNVRLDKDQKYWGSIGPRIRVCQGQIIKNLTKK